TTMTILFGPQGTFGWFSYTTSRDTIEAHSLILQELQGKSLCLSSGWKRGEHRALGFFCELHPW
ncbi:hypothetical protein LU646_27380, partial [Pseudomonas alloputida]|nr:hypothetical protein [Pseudomonas alloputida]